MSTAAVEISTPPRGTDERSAGGRERKYIIVRTAEVSRSRPDTVVLGAVQGFEGETLTS